MKKYFRNRSKVLVETIKKSGDREKLKTHPPLGSTHPFLEVSSSKELMPTSITTAPGLIQSALTISARPAAQTTISASLTCWEAFVRHARRGDGGVTEIDFRSFDYFRA